ncbi:hypothetical protein V8F33_012016 [Rhypophila sp. PSN 637]
MLLCCSEVFFLLTSLHSLCCLLCAPPGFFMFIFSSNVYLESPSHCLSLSHDGSRFYSKRSRWSRQVSIIARDCIKTQ